MGSPTGNDAETAAAPPAAAAAAVAGGASSSPLKQEPPSSLAQANPTTSHPAGAELAINPSDSVQPSLKPEGLSVGERGFEEGGFSRREAQGGADLPSVQTTGWAAVRDGQTGSAAALAVTNAPGNMPHISSRAAFGGAEDGGIAGGDEGEGEGEAFAGGPDGQVELPGGLPGGPNREHLFEKSVTPSDVGKLNRLVIPKQHAERCFPLDPGLPTPAMTLSFEDEGGKHWRFRYSYWSSSQSYVLTKGWSRFVKEKLLVPGDIVFFDRGPNGELYIGYRRRPAQGFVAMAGSGEDGGSMGAEGSGGAPAGFGGFGEMEGGEGGANGGQGGHGGGGMWQQQQQQQQQGQGECARL